MTSIELKLNPQVKIELRQKHNRAFTRSKFSINRSYLMTTALYAQRENLYHDDNAVALSALFHCLLGKLRHAFAAAELGNVNKDGKEGVSSFISNTRKLLKLQSLLTKRGHVAVSVGEIEMKRYVVPLSCLNHPSLQYLLRQAEENSASIIL
ncbi:hypothetical protein Cgig2_002897 [Carnegiea gigantea]|uniref:Uncharacterized protein n=1 Tax=Carnegiea gigantea TaxID=171969 RepID=A0A9Q1KN82_9CARY|nr:hypothetical protein Cgig2_002897 [Carnegiea gigantea]